MSRSQNSRSVQPIVTVVLLAAMALACVLVTLLAGGETASVTALVSPLSPLSSGGPSLSFTPLPMVNVMASGQAALMRLTLLLVAIIVGVGIVVWRQS